MVVAGVEIRAVGSTIFFLLRLDSLGEMASKVGPLVGLLVALSELSRVVSSTILGELALATSAGLSVITRSLSLSRSFPWPLATVGLTVPTPAPFAVSSASACLIVVTVTSLPESALSAGCLASSAGLLSRGIGRDVSFLLATCVGGNLP